MSEPYTLVQGGIDLTGLGYSTDLWLSQVTGIACYNVSEEGLSPEPVSDLLAPPAFFTARVNVGEVSKLHDWTRRGFRLVDTSLTLRLDEPDGNAIRMSSLSDQLVIDAVRPKDADVVASLAAAAFHLSRFHLDPEFPTPIASRIKANWARNLASGLRGSGCLVARRGGQVVAFLGFSQIHDSVPRTVIDLVAVEPSVQGSGVGTALASALIATVRHKGRPVVVGTQVANRSSIRFYERLGFRYETASYVLHALLRAPGAG